MSDIKNPLKDLVFCGKLSLCISPQPSPEGEGTPLLLQEKGLGDEVKNEGDGVAG